MAAVVTIALLAVAGAGDVVVVAGSSIVLADRMVMIMALPGMVWVPITQVSLPLQPALIQSSKLPCFRQRLHWLRAHL